MSDNAAATQTQQPSDTQQSGQGQERAPVVDYSELLAAQQAELARTGKTVEQLRSDLGESRSAIDRVKRAFVGEEDQQKVSPYQRRIKEFDDLGSYLDQESLENQKNGGAGMPITTKIGKQLVNYAKESESRAEKLEQELAEIKQALKRQQNPAFQGLERAAFVMEGMVDDALQALYGAEPGSKGIRSAQFDAVTARINDEIKDLMKNDPDALLKVQRNPKVMRRMVNHFMAEMLPPKVRTMMDEERIKATPMDARDLFQAFSEAREGLEDARGKGDQRAVAHYDNLMTSIRQDILANQLAGRKGDVNKPTLNQLFTTVVGGR
jgi:hypothetical protein